MFSLVFAVQFMPADRRKFCNKKKFEHCFVQCIRPSRAFGGGRKARLFSHLSF